MNQYVNVTVPVPEAVLLSLRVEHDEFASQIKELAAMKLYENRKLSIGQSAEFAGMDTLSFMKFLGKNKISIFGSASDIEEDFKNA
jgi:predicted HTH domain antitoxin